MKSEFESLPEGAIWHRCALHVNPFSYLAANGKSVEGLSDEESYNAALIDALIKKGITVIAITDHWRIESAIGLRDAAREARITVFPGFEATAKDGVHLNVLFDPSAETANINRHIGECGIPADCHDARPGSLDTTELLERVETWRAVAIAPHVTTAGGLLVKLSGQTAIRAWTDSRLRAVGVGGATPRQGDEAILANKDPAYHRANPPAILRAADISSPADVAKSGSSCWIKLSSLTLGGLDLAFRTPVTRVSQSDPTNCAHARVIGIEWNGGFLDGVKLRLNESLNVLIGGRGSGKSTVIESLRYALDIQPLAENSKDEHNAMVKHVLGAGTKIRLEVQVRAPSQAGYIVERLVGSAPVVRDMSGNLLHSAPGDLLRGTAAYGQRELAELARDKQRLTSLLLQYLPDGADRGEDAVKLRRDLDVSRREVVVLEQELEDLEARLSRIPVIEERLARFDTVGIAAKLEDQALAQRERQLLRRAASSVHAPSDLISGLTVETSYLGEDDASVLPNAQILIRAKLCLDEYNITVRRTFEVLAEAHQKTMTELSLLQTTWESTTKVVRDELDRVLRELQPDGIDGDEYLRLRNELGNLTPLTTDKQIAERKLEDTVAGRATLLVAAEDRRAARLRELQREAKRVGRSLPGTLQASVHDGGDRSLLAKLLRDRIDGRLDNVCSAILDASLLSPRAFAQTCRGGSDAILAVYPTVTASQATRLANASSETLMLAEEIEFPISTDLQLNVGAKDAPIWRSLDQLSTGQRATALLLLLMSRGEGPLIVDQPEDDLDNRFIYEDIVPRIREAKGKRQMILSSHNANIPVLGDADQIVALVAEDHGGGVSGKVIDNGLGSIDHPPIREMVEELLEGGREAFNTRRYLYGF